MEPQSKEFGGITLINEEGELPEFEALCDRIERLYEYIGEIDSETCILLVSDEEIRALNAEWRDVDESTDVLSFPMREGEEADIAETLPLGDIAISVETARRQVLGGEHLERLSGAGKDLGVTWTLLDELSFLVIHGTLHLLGYDHADPEEEAVMRAKEAEWMSWLINGDNRPHLA